MKKFFTFIIISLILCLSSCAVVDVTKTAKGFYEPTDPNNVEILMIQPENRPYIEIGSIAAANFDPKETAKLHNALRNKSALLGAHAVVIKSSGFNDDGLWATGVAIRWDIKE